MLVLLICSSERSHPTFLTKTYGDLISPEFLLDTTSLVSGFSAFAELQFKARKQPNFADDATASSGKRDSNGLPAPRLADITRLNTPSSVPSTPGPGANQHANGGHIVGADPQADRLFVTDADAAGASEVDDADVNGSRPPTGSSTGSLPAPLPAAVPASDLGSLYKFDQPIKRYQQTKRELIATIAPFQLHTERLRQLAEEAETEKLMQAVNEGLSTSTSPPQHPDGPAGGPPADGGEGQPQAQASPPRR